VLVWTRPRIPVQGCTKGGSRYRAGTVYRSHRGRQLDARPDRQHAEGLPNRCENLRTHVPASAMHITLGRLPSFRRISASANDLFGQQGLGVHYRAHRKLLLLQHPHMQLTRTSLLQAYIFQGADMSHDFAPAFLL
jgi:hypothetical protein